MCAWMRVRMYACVFVRMYVCVCVGMHAGMRMRACVHVCMHAVTRVCMYACAYANVYVYAVLVSAGPCVHVRVCTYACMHAWWYACMRVCTCACMHARTPSHLTSKEARQRASVQRSASCRLTPRECLATQTLLRTSVHENVHRDLKSGQLTSCCCCCLLWPAGKPCESSRLVKRAVEIRQSD